MLETFTAQTFSPYVGDTFLLPIGEVPPIELKLVSVTELNFPAAGRGTADPPKRVPFSLLFRNSQRLYFPQAIYHIEHEQLGAMQIFMVPMGPDAEGMQYEAIFN